MIPLAVVIFLVFILDFYIESFCVAKLESLRTGKIGSIASFLSAVIIALLWDKPWAWSMHEWHHGKSSEPHLVSAGTLFSAFFFVLGKCNVFVSSFKFLQFTELVLFVSFIEMRHQANLLAMNVILSGCFEDLKFCYF